MDENSYEEVIKEVSKYDYLGLKEEIERVRIINKIISELKVKTKVDLGFVRGLAYYTGVIFEVTHPKVPFSIAGGGRYDELIRLYGGNDTPAIGFAIGIERTSLVLNSVISQKSPKKGVLIILSESRGSNNYDEGIISYGFKTLEKLRQLGLAITLNLKEQSLSKLIPLYLEEGYSFLVIIGGKEFEERKVTIKNLENKTQVTIPENNIEDYVKQII